MPTLEELLRELEKLSVHPKEVRVSGVVYDTIYDEAESIVEDSEGED